MKLLLLMAAMLSLAAAPPPSKPAEDAEESELQQALAEAGSSPVEYSRVLEAHLKKYPKSAQADSVRRALVQVAVEMRDKRLLIEYGVPLLDAGSKDPQVLDHVTRALLDKDDPESLKKALIYSRRLEEVLAAQVKLLKESKEATPGRGGRIDDYEQRLSRSQIFQARALGGLGNNAEAVEMARKAYATYSSAEAAREIGRALERSGKLEEALPFYAEAFAFPDQRSADAQRTRDRVKLGEISKQVKGSEGGLGDMILSAYDHASAELNARRERLRALDPNALATEPSEFVLSGLQGQKIALSSLKGKVAVLDFWATWCGPCRAQHPLYQQVEQRFKDNKDVVFLAVNTDDDRSLVAPFLEAQKWNKDVYFEDGLATLLRVSSIPTTMILGRNGQLYSRLNGFVPDRFVEMLTERIKAALAVQ
jgi:thiol-disulfide isomerase/thioredoxin